jgi:hypothetical protein
MNDDVESKPLRISEILIWVPSEKVSEYESSGWRIAMRWSFRPFFDSYLMAKEDNGLQGISTQENSTGNDGRIQADLDA